MQRHQQQDRAEAEPRADQAADEAQCRFVQRLADGAEGDEEGR